MEYCASAASMLAEIFWQIAEEFVEFLHICGLKIKKVEETYQMINNVDS